MSSITGFKRTKYACFYTYVAMSSIFSLPPILFVTFHDLYGISYTLLGTLVLTNFCTQLTVDLIFSFFTKYFNFHKTIRFMPLLTTAGLAAYACAPWVFPGHEYAGLLLGTVIFSVAAGLCEALLSPMMAAIPSETPDRDMSMFHSLYAYGVLMVVLVSTAFMKLFGTENWMYLSLFWALLPVGSFILFSISPMPDVDVSHGPGAGEDRSRRIGMILCVLCIFLGSATENTMTNWIPGYMEKALNIPKTVSDVLGLAVFAVLLGLTRTWYAKRGRNIMKVLLVSMAGAVFCYLTAGIFDNVIVCTVACTLTGIFTSMLWPGALIMMEENMPGPGVAAYALMAAGGDFGASVAPQLMGAVVDAVAASGWAAEMSGALLISTEQIGMKVGMLISSVFPMLGVAALIVTSRYFRKHRAQA
ncbi:MAG: MFS transporter [Clostridia bacterium]|nr:MFS transporter [Clostridia bacterium]